MNASPGLYDFLYQMEGSLAPVSSSEHHGLLVGFITFAVNFLTSVISWFREGIIF